MFTVQGAVFSMNGTVQSDENTVGCSGLSLKRLMVHSFVFCVQVAGCSWSV